MVSMVLARNYQNGNFFGHSNSWHLSSKRQHEAQLPKGLFDNPLGFLKVAGVDLTTSLWAHWRPLKRRIYTSTGLETPFVTYTLSGVLPVTPGVQKNQCRALFLTECALRIKYRQVLLVFMRVPPTLLYTGRHPFLGYPYRGCCLVLLPMLARVTGSSQTTQKSNNESIPLW